MANVTFNGTTFACATAIKGSNYIHLLDADGCIIVAFEGVKNFTPFSISNGSWVTPTEDNKCPVAVMREDGTVAKGEHTCEDIGIGKEHTNNKENPHGVTKSQVGLGNVTDHKQMPIAGGTFTGNAKAYETARTTRGLFNEETRSSSTTGTLQSVQYFINVTD